MKVCFLVIENFGFFFVLGMRLKHEILRFFENGMIGGINFMSIERVFLENCLRIVLFFCKLRKLKWVIYYEKISWVSNIYLSLPLSLKKSYFLFDAFLVMRF